MTKIKPIETMFDGLMYRSKLEACWAAFFKNLGIWFEYEPEGFDLDGRNYLPDFLLPEIRDGLWIEIKPKWDQAASELCSRLHRATGDEVVMLCGSPSTVILEHKNACGWMTSKDTLFVGLVKFRNYLLGFQDYEIEKAAIDAHHVVRWSPMKSADEAWQRWRK